MSVDLVFSLKGPAESIYLITEPPNVRSAISQLAIVNGPGDKQLTGDRGPRKSDESKFKGVRTGSRLPFPFGVFARGVVPGNLELIAVHPIQKL